MEISSHEIWPLKDFDENLSQVLSPQGLERGREKTRGSDCHNSEEIL